MTGFVGAAAPLTRQGFRAVLDDLGIGTAELLALLTVESGRVGFLSDRRPVVLFERHHFHKFTKGRFTDANPDISNPRTGGYKGGRNEYSRIEKAAGLERNAALKSASWGVGQIMGFNHKMVGFEDVESMVAAMQESEDQQLLAVSRFLKANRLDRALRKHDWVAVARAYNGRAYAKHKYDVRLAAAYQMFTAGLTQDVEVRRAQLLLTYLGYAPRGVDGLHGKFSRSAVVKFRQDNGMTVTERVDKALIAALMAKVQA